MDPLFVTPPSASPRFKTIIYPRNKYEIFNALTIQLFQNELLLSVFITSARACGLLAKMYININGGIFHYTQSFHKHNSVTKELPVAHMYASVCFVCEAADPV
jgi:hypothetical protein